MAHISDFERVRNYFGEENLPILLNLVLTRKPFIIDDTSFYLRSLGIFSPHRKVVYSDSPDNGFLIETKKIFKKEKSSDQKTLLLINHVNGETFELLGSIPIGWVAASSDFPTTFGLPVFKNETKEFNIMLKNCIACGAGIELNARYCAYCGATTRGKKGSAFSVPYDSLSKDFRFEENIILELLQNSDGAQNKIILKTIKDLHTRAKKLIEIYQTEKNPEKIRKKLRISSDMLSRLALIATNEYYQNLGVVPQRKEEVLSPWCPNCGKKIKIGKGLRKCKKCGWNERLEDTSKYILKIAGIKNKKELEEIVLYLIDRARRELGYDCFEFTDITDSLAKDIASWIHEKQLPSIIHTDLTEVYLKKLASLLFKIMCRSIKGKNWVMQVA